METLNFKRNIPNILTIFRMILVIPILVLFFIPLIGNIYSFQIEKFTINISINNFIILILFVIASISDWADGYISRKYKWVSNFGKILDPIADKVLVNTLLIILGSQNYTLLVFTILFVIRDIIVDAMRMYSASNKIIVPANIFGKIKTVLQMLAIILILMIGAPLHDNMPLWWYWAVQNTLMYFALIASLLSGVIYIADFIKSSKKAKKN